MDWYQSFWLGLTQGITEIVPVSSSGHVEIMQQIFGGRGEGFHLLMELITFGSLLALIVSYRKQIMEIFVDIFRNKNCRLLINILLSAIPCIAVGLLLYSFIESNWFFSNMLVIASALALVGIAMIAVERLPHLSKVKGEKQLSKPRALLVGATQCFAIIPGISRAGSALFAGRIVGMDSKTSFRYANLVGIPVLATIAVKSVVSSASRHVLVNNFQTIAFANAIAFVAGIIILHFLTKYFDKKNTLKPFGVYRIVMALIILVFELIR